MPIKNLIITGANTAREFQEPFNYKETLESTGDYGITNQMQLDWQKQESSLKEYRITGRALYNEKGKIIMIHPNFWDYTFFQMGYKTICEVNEETLEAIIL